MEVTMSATTGGSEQIAEDLLPENYDDVVTVEKLVHGDHNPRRVRPKPALKNSIAESGINRPLIVRPDPERDVYHVTDGWQRLQAATACGWEVLPVRIYDTPLDALEATETESIVREWSTYEWARYCQAVASELDAESTQELVEQVADRTVKSAGTVRRYLDVLSLPDEIHPLLTDGPAGSSQEWTALKHYNSEVRRYDGLRWAVAARLARRQSSLTEDRVIGIAAVAVEFEESDDAMEFVDRAAENPGAPLQTIRQEVLFGQQHDRYLEVPGVAVRLDQSEKRAVMDHCRRNRRSLDEIVTDAVQSLVAELADE